MTVWRIQSPLDERLVPVPMAPIAADWWGRPVDPAPRFALIEDPEHLWLVAGHEQPAHPHPTAGAGEFVEGLWQYDVAECFIAGPQGYLEFNLSPAGAWWCARFSAPRLRAEGMPRPLGLTRVLEPQNGGGWLAALGIPLGDLRRETGWPDGVRINVTFIVGTPQRFLTVADLGGGAPDYHRPDAFETIAWRDG